MIHRRNIVFAINAGLQFTPQFLPDAPLDAAYSQTLRAFGGRPLYRFFLLSGSLPTGLSLTDNGDGTATIDGTATEGGSFDFRLLLIDGERNEVTADYNINVQAAPLSLSGNIGATDEGQPFTGGLSASGGVPPYTYSLSGDVPPGLSVNSSTGAAQGSATDAGDYSFTGTVVDSEAATVSVPQSVSVQSVATYATWNPLDKSSLITLSNGNLTATRSGSNGNRLVRATIANSSGKEYFEVTVNTIVAVDGNQIGAMIGGTTVDTKPSLVNGVAGGGAALTRGGSLEYMSNTATNTTRSGSGLTALVSGDVVMVAIDHDNHKLYVGKNGTWGWSGDPSTDTNPSLLNPTVFPSVPIYAALGMFNNTVQFTANFGATPFAYTVPTGYRAGIYTE